MTRKLLFVTSLFFLISALITSCIRTDKKATDIADLKEINRAFNLKPFRVLVIIGDQWTDPMSYNIDTRRVKGTDFLDVVNMLKIWGVPFDILRLDEQRLQINRFLDGEAKPNYGCVIWMADPDKLQGFSANYKTLKRAVEEYGISMIALFDNIKTQPVADLIGVNVQNIQSMQIGENNDKFAITASHFITSEAAGVSLPDVKQTILKEGETFQDAVKNGANKTTISVVNCTVDTSTKVLGAVGSIPQLVVRDVTNRTKVVWIGGGKDWFRKYPVMRWILRKALVYSIGYGLFNDNFENGFIFTMDDIGCADHSWYLRWHYPTPPRDTLIKYLIEPLEKYGFIMVQAITSGFVNTDKQIIESPWKVKPFKDIYDNWQDYGSSKEGLDEGMRRGVFEIQHDRAWSHMNWDLESPPGPFWNSPVDGEKGNGDWYNEVSDVTRGNTPVPSNDLLFLYKTGIDAVKKAFGVIPLSAEIYPGSDLNNGTHSGDDNGRIAAIAGIGVARESYVGIDHTIEFAMMFPEQFVCHDLDLTPRTNNPADQMGRWSDCWPVLEKLNTEQLLSAKIAGVRSVNLHNTDWIESRKDKHWMGLNETCAYLHANIASPGKNGIEFFYDDHYCKYFEKKPSSWTLELSDSFRENLGRDATLSVDGKIIMPVRGLRQNLEIPAGLGTHRIEFHRGQ
jgi:hypothetical protein